MPLLIACRACLRPMGHDGRAGICGSCWSALRPLAKDVCTACATPHTEGGPCSGPTPWFTGHALWDYHAGRPSLGHLLVPGIKRGEAGWRRALLDRLDTVPLAEAWPVELLVTWVPSSPLHRLWRGFDLGQASAAIVARRLGSEAQACLGRRWFSPRQGGASASRRRRLPANTFQALPDASVTGRHVLLVDDVWTTGTTLAHGTRILLAAGAASVRVLALFRAMPE